MCAKGYYSLDFPSTFLLNTSPQNAIFSRVSFSFFIILLENCRARINITVPDVKNIYFCIFLKSCLKLAWRFPFYEPIRMFIATITTFRFRTFILASRCMFYYMCISVFYALGSQLFQVRRLKQKCIFLTIIALHVYKIWFQHWRKFITFLSFWTFYMVEWFLKYERKKSIYCHTYNKIWILFESLINIRNIVKLNICMENGDDRYIYTINIVLSPFFGKSINFNRLFQFQLSVAYRKDFIYTLKINWKLKESWKRFK